MQIIHFYRHAYCFTNFKYISIPNITWQMYWFALFKSRGVVCIWISLKKNIKNPIKIMCISKLILFYFEAKYMYNALFITERPTANKQTHNLNGHGLPLNVNLLVEWELSCCSMGTQMFVFVFLFQTCNGLFVHKWFTTGATILVLNLTYLQKRPFKGFSLFMYFASFLFY